VAGKLAGGSGGCTRIAKEKVIMNGAERIHEEGVRTSREKKGRSAKSLKLSTIQTRIRYAIRRKKNQASSLRDVWNVKEGQTVP